MKRAASLGERLVALFVVAALLFAAPLVWHGSALGWFALWAAVIGALALLMERAVDD